MDKKLSEFPPGVVEVFIDGVYRPEILHVAVDWPDLGAHGEHPWVSMSTHAGDTSYLTPPLEQLKQIERVVQVLYGGEVLDGRVWNLMWEDESRVTREDWVRIARRILDALGDDA